MTCFWRFVPFQVAQAHGIRVRHGPIFPVLPAEDAGACEQAVAPLPVKTVEVRRREKLERFSGVEFRQVEQLLRRFRIPRGGGGKQMFGVKQLPEGEQDRGIVFRCPAEHFVHRVKLPRAALLREAIVGAHDFLLQGGGEAALAKGKRKKGRVTRSKRGGAFLKTVQKALHRAAYAMPAEPAEQAEPRICCFALLVFHYFSTAPVFAELTIRA
jgi:hypothetical protein